MNHLLLFMVSLNVNFGHACSIRVHHTLQIGSKSWYGKCAENWEICDVLVVAHELWRAQAVNLFETQHVN